MGSSLQEKGSTALDKRGENDVRDIFDPFDKREDGQVSRAEHPPESSRLNQGPGSGRQPGKGLIDID